MAGGRIDVEVGIDNRGFASKFRSAVTSGASGAFGALAGLAKTALVTTGAVAGAGFVQGLKTAANLEQAEVAFDTLLKGGDKAKQFLGELKDFAAKTPFELPGLVDNAKKLLGVGVAAEQVIPTMTALGDASAALGLSQEGMDRAVRAVTQSYAKGKVQAEEMLQISETGIPIWDLLSKSMGKSVPELQDMMLKGELLADDVFPKLYEQMNKDYGGALAKQSQTLSGVWSTLKDTINLALSDGVQPFLPAIKSVTVAFGELAVNGIKRASLGLQEFAVDAKQSYADFMQGFGGGRGGGVAGALGRLATEAKDKLGPLGDVLQEQLAQKGALAGQAFRDVIIPAASGAFDILAKLAGPAREFGQVAGTVLTAGVKAAGRVVEAFTDNADEIGDTLQVAGSILAGVAKNALPVFVRGMELAADVAETAISVIAGVGDVIEPIAPLLTGLGTAALAAWAAFKGYTILKDASTAFAGWATSLGSNVASKLQDAGAGAMVFADRVGASAKTVDGIGGTFDKAAGKASGFGAKLAGAAGKLPLVGIGIGLATVAFQLLDDAIETTSEKIEALGEKNRELTAQYVTDSGVSTKAATATLDQIKKNAAEQDALLEKEYQQRKKNWEQNKAAGRDASAEAPKRQKMLIDQVAMAELAAKSQYDAMSLVEQKQQDVTVAQNNLNDAIKKYPADSDAVKSASEALADAQSDLAFEQDKVAKATQTATQKLAEQAQQALASSNANVGLQQAMLNLVEPMNAYVKAKQDANGADIEGTQAAIDAYNAAINAANAAAIKADAEAKAAGVTDTTIATNQAMIDSLQATKDQYGSLPAEAQKTLTALKQSQAQALLTAGGFDIVSASIVAVPDSKSVIISDNSPETIKKLQGLGYVVETLPDGTIKVTADTQPALAGAQATVTKINSMSGTITIYTNQAGVSTNTTTGTKYNARGNIVEMYRNGGIHGRKLRPMMAGLASIVAPNTWRVVGDNTKVPEAYIPIDRQNSRSRALLEETARRMGYQLVRAFADGGINGPSVAVSGVGGPMELTGRLYLDSGELLGTVRGVVNDAVASSNRSSERELSYARNI